MLSNRALSAASALNWTSGPILNQIEAADALVLGSPVNYGNVTAIFRTFMERLIGFAYWPWGQPRPRHGISGRSEGRAGGFVGHAGFLIPLATGTGHALRTTAKMLGARPVGSLWIGLAAQEPHPSCLRVSGGERGASAGSWRNPELLIKVR